jgi:hypothetical protein
VETVIGALVGAFAVVIGQWLQGRRVEQSETRAAKREEERERRSEDRDRASVAAHRARESALRIDELAVTLHKDLPEYLLYMRRSKEGTQAEEARWAALGESNRERLRELELLAVDLPDEVRSRVETAIQVLEDCDDIGNRAWNGGWHYHGDREIARNTCWRLHALLAAFLRGQPLPRPTAVEIEYEAALDMLLEERQAEYAQEIAESQNARAAWLDAHPEVAKAIGERTEREQ